MFCEACGAKGLDREAMTVDPNTKLFIGPCCTGRKEVVLGLELSSKRGLKAYLKYNGLKIEYEKPFNELPITNERNEFQPSKEERIWPEGTPVGEA